MTNRTVAFVVAMVAGLSLPVAATAALPSLGVQQILEKNATARGGLSSWRSLQTLSWKGHMGAGASTYATVNKKGAVETKERPEAELPFVYEFKRPHKSRLEIQFNGQTAVQVYDGTAGWKVRPYLGRSDAQPYTPTELKQAALDPGVDGYLIDAAAKGYKVELAGTEKVEDRDAYKLKVTIQGGAVRHVWVDGETFLESKIEGTPRVIDGRPRPVAIYPRDYHSDGGLHFPHLLETAVEGLPKHEKLTIDTVVVNPALADTRFAKPQ